MSWARFDDLFPWHRKVRRLSDGAFRLHVTAICYASRDLTDGVILRTDLDDLPSIRQVDRRVDELVRAGVWDVVEDGWRVHDYLDYNPSRAKVHADRAAVRERQRRWAERRERERAAEDARDAARRPNALGDALGDASLTPSLTLPRPDPSRPDPTRPVLEVVGEATSPPSALTSQAGKSSSSSSSRDLRARP